jgi:prolactin regulatory element-binding protein
MDYYRYGRGTNCKTLYTILNYLPNKKKKHTPSIWGPAADPRKAVLMTWNLDNGTPGRSKTISHKPVTCLDMSPSGHLLAFSSSDLSIGILDASSLRVSPSLPLITIFFFFFFFFCGNVH